MSEKRETWERHKTAISIPRGWTPFSRFDPDLGPDLDCFYGGVQVAEPVRAMDWSTLQLARNAYKRLCKGNNRDNWVPMKYIDIIEAEMNAKPLVRTRERQAAIVWLADLCDDLVNDYRTLKRKIAECERMRAARAAQLRGELNPQPDDDRRPQPGAAWSAQR